MKLGITTQTFLNAMTASVKDTCDVIKYAAEQGLDFVEIRNRNFQLSELQLKQIKECAAEENVELCYAWDGGSLLDESYKDTYDKHFEYASMLGNETIIRAIIDPLLIKSREYPLDYTEKEMTIIQKRLPEVIKMSEGRNVLLTYENSYESIWGITELIKRNPQMRMTLDTANFLNIEQQKKTATPAEILSFYQQNRDIIPYIHIKSTKENILKDTVITDGDFDWNTLFDGFEGWVCIEIPPSGSFTDCMKRVKFSIDAIHNILKTGK